MARTNRCFHPNILVTIFMPGKGFIIFGSCKECFNFIITLSHIVNMFVFSDKVGHQTLIHQWHPYVILLTNKATSFALFLCLSDHLSFYPSVAACHSFFLLHSLSLTPPPAVTVVKASASLWMCSKWNCRSRSIRYLSRFTGIAGAKRASY